MKKEKRKRPAVLYEYSLLITKVFKERDKKVVTLVALRTIKEFSNFQYEIIVNDTLEGKKLQLAILGLHAPQQTIPGGGPAIFKKEYTGIKGKYDVVVTRLDGKSNTFAVNISEESVRIIKSPRAKFVTLTTSEKEW